MGLFSRTLDLNSTKEHQIGAMLKKTRLEEYSRNPCVSNKKENQKKNTILEHIIKHQIETILKKTKLE